MCVPNLHFQFQQLLLIFCHFLQQQHLQEQQEQQLVLLKLKLKYMLKLLK